MKARYNSILIVGLFIYALICFSPSHAEDYIYDHLGRLTKVTNCDGSTINYSYDNAGNRTVMTTTSATKSIKVTSPNSAVSWTLGSTQTVTWTSSNVTGNVDIQLSRDGGLTWETLAANTTNDGSQSVLVSGTPTTQARGRVRATSCSQLKDEGDVNFFIAANGADFTPPDTTITVTLCGQILSTNSATITWTGSDNVTPPGSLQYQWKLDNGDWTAAAMAISSTLPALANGMHSFEVRAIDQAGNTDASPAGCAFTVDTGGSQVPTITLMTPSSGAPGTTVTILGANLLNAAALSFGGVSAGFTATSATSIVATVPSGALTGPVTVTTPNGTATSAVTFMVLGTGGGGASCPTTSFTQPALYSLNIGAEALLMADFNRDGLPDIVAANKGSNFVTVKLGNGNGSFGGNVNYTVNQPSALAAGDFNLDGNLDLVAANQSSSGIISVLLGNGAGGFGASVTFPAATDTRSIAVADFNADGKPDIVAGSVATDPSVVAVLLNTSSGGTLSFGPATNFTIGYGPSGIATGDFNGDGKIDLATANSGSSNISVLLGIGNGSFQPSVQYSTPVGPPNAVLANDFTGDGKLDLVFDYFGVSSVSVWRGNGDGTFTSIADSPLFAPARGMSAGDFTNDGKLDLALALPNVNTVDILLGNGAGGFTTSASYGVAYSAIATGVGDFDGNGKLDVAATSAIGSLAVLINGCVECRYSLSPSSQTVGAGGGTVGVNVMTTNGCGWTATSNASWISISSGAAGNGNGAVQLSIASNTGPQRTGTITIAGQAFIVTQQDSSCAITVNPASLPGGTIGSAYNQTISAMGGAAPYSFNLTSGALPAGLTLSGGGALTGTLTAAGTFNFSVTVTDADGCVGMRSYTITVNNPAYCSPAGIVLGQPNGSPYSAGREPHSIAVGDFTSDGIQDIAVAGQAVTIQVGLGDGRFTQPNAPFDVVGLPSSVATGDFNGDGKKDLAVASSVNVAIMLGNGNGTFTPAAGSPVSSGNGTGPRYVVVGDFNGDSKQDLAVANSFSANVAILMGDGSGGFSPAVGSPFSAGSQPVSLGVGDFNGDGKQDLAVADHSSNNARILLGNGSGGFSLFSSPIVGNNPISVAMGDFNGDGKQDFAIALDTSSNNVTIQLGNGDGSFTETGSPINLGTTPTSVAVGDFNGDGKPDLVVAHQNANATILQGDGSGSFSPVAGSPVAVGSNPSFVAVGDFNGDGKPDFAVGNQNSDNLTIQLNNCAPMISTVAVSRLQGSPASASIIANASDAGQAASTLNVNVNGGASATVNGVTVSNLGIDAGGVVTANVFAGCSALTANFTLMVTDGLNGTGTATLTVTVNANPSPTLTYNNQLVAPGGSLTFTPASGPSDNGSVSSIVLQSQGTYTGTINVNNSTGFVSLSNAAPNGVHTITIRATDQCGATTNAVFTLTVNVVIPTLSNYPNTTVIAGGNTTVTPVAPPVNAGSITAATSTNFKGLLSVNPTTGVLTVTNAHVAGIYTVTVIAANTSGGTNTRDFTLTVANPINCAPSSFTFSQSTGSPVGAGNRPYFVAVGDFNSDGKQDLAVAHHSDDNNLTILLGNGNSSFSEASGSPVAVGSVPNFVAVGDFNGDGKQDLAVANEVSNNVTILLGNGSGGFSPAAGSPVTVGTNPYSIGVSDFNGDGKQDLAVANLNSDYVTILVGNGSGGFSPDGNSPSVGDGPISVAVGDFNGDGKQDLATANSNSNNITILLGNGGGGFSPAPGSPVSVGNTPYSVAVGDFNGDSKQDLAVAQALSSNITILIGNGIGGFSLANGSPVSVAGNPQSLGVGDFNGDGTQDLAVPSTNTNNVTILLGNGGGGFSSFTGSPIAVGTTPLYVAVGDFNGDGKQDIATANLNSNNVTVLLNNCAPLIIAGPPLTRQQGGPGTVSTIASVNDTETPVANLTVTPTTVPAGILITDIANNSGTITAKVTVTCNAAVGANLAVLTLTDLSGLASTANLTVNVLANDMPTLTYTNQSVALGGSLTINPTTGLSDNGSIASIVVESVIPMMTISPTISINGVVSVTNAGFAGPHTITIRANDNCGATTVSSFTLSVNCPAITLSPMALSSGMVGQPYLTNNLIANGGTPSYSFALSGGELPSGMMLTTSGALQGTPTAFGPFNFTVRATDTNGCFGEQAYSLLICPIITITPTTLTAGTIGMSYPVTTLMPSGGVSPYTFTIPVGSLPNGMNLSPSGVLDGTPTVNGTFPFTVRATDNSGSCFGEQAYSLVINVNCMTITINPQSLPNGFVGTLYNQALSATGGTPNYTFSLASGMLPNGVSIVGTSLMGTPTTTGTFSFTIKATDNVGCMGTRVYTAVISGTGLQFYPLAHPVRMVDTRSGATACQTPGAPITGGTSLTVPVRGVCDMLTVPANAAAVTGNVTTVGPVANGFLTIYPSGATQPQASNSNYQIGQTLNNVFTVGLGAIDGAFKVFALNTTDVVVDVTGYFAPPGTGGLFFHPLAAPVRLLDTRQTATNGCTLPGNPLQAGVEFLQQGNTTCGIPSTALALVGNATTVGPIAQGFLTLFPADATRPLIASGNYRPGQTLNSPITVGLSPSGQFKIYSSQQTDLVVDVLGYYSADASDGIGIGLLFSPMTPARLLDTRTMQTACFTPGIAIPAMTDTVQFASGSCTIPSTAQAIVGNATTVSPAAQGFLTFWPSNATRPTAATSNYAAGVNFNRHYTVGLGPNGAFNIYALTSTHLVVDVSGFLAP